MAKILIAAGGTGGHVFPALAVAKALVARGDCVTWCGTKAGIEATVVPKANFALKLIRARPLRGKGLVGCLFGAGCLFFSVAQVMGQMLVDRPDVVLVMGGYVAAPVGIAAKLLRVRLILHEQNAVAGLANRLLFYLADQVLVAFAGAFEGEKVKLVGNPVRKEISRITKLPGQDKLRCLVLGGSQGAKVLNQQVSSAWLSMDEVIRPVLWHQVGARDEDFYQEKYSQHKSQVQLSGFIESMAKAYAWADVVIARSGAMTVAECLAVGLPVAWVPYPYAADNHQYYNARSFLKMSHGWLWLQDQLEVSQLVEWWGHCQDDLQKGSLVAKVVKNDAVENILRFI